MSNEVDVLDNPLALRCGLVLPNRLVKAAMAEAMSKDGMPSEGFRRPYQVWARGGWGMVITGCYSSSLYDHMYALLIGYRKRTD
jgi:2,4-dienoyl-CoA reductase-like NADH-dependent reductase (Old Yellow Enzyme family)